MLRKPARFDASGDVASPSYCVVASCADDPAFIAIPVVPFALLLPSLVAFFVSTKSGHRRAEGARRPRESGCRSTRWTAPVVGSEASCRDEYGRRPRAAAKYWTGGEEEPGRDEKAQARPAREIQAENHIGPQADASRR